MAKPRTADLESALRHVWGVMLLADSVIDDPKVKAAFLKVDQLCRATGMQPRQGIEFIEPKDRPAP
jgi:hypothetical protein